MEDSGRYQCSSNGRTQWVDLTVVESQISNHNCDDDGDDGDDDDDDDDEVGQPHSR